MMNFMYAVSQLNSIQSSAAYKKMKEWQTKLDGMPASSSLEDADKDQLELDITKIVAEISS